jgi:hydrogenase maturation protease
MSSVKTIILGLGNDILSDDRIGPDLVYDLSKILDNPDITFETASSGGLELMETIKNFKRVIIIDAIHTRDGKPGNVYYFRPSDFQETSHLSSLHDVDFLTALKLGDKIGMNLTDDLHVIAVEIVEDREFSEELTADLKQKYRSILNEVITMVKGIMSL